MDSSSLPSKLDISPTCGLNLDEQRALSNFLGLKIEQATTRFCANSLALQEDFMFMGEVAFEYYFQVIDNYFHDESSTGDVDCVNWLARIFDFRYGDRPSALPLQLSTRLIRLLEYIEANSTKFAGTDVDIIRTRHTSGLKKIRRFIERTMNKPDLDE